MKVRCNECTERRDGQFIVFYRTVPGGLKASALSPVPVEVGRDCIVSGGKVVKP